MLPYLCLVSVSGLLSCVRLLGPNSSVIMLVMQVTLLYEENTLLDEENKRLLKRYREDKIQHSGDKQANGGSAAKVRLIYILCTYFSAVLWKLNSCTTQLGQYHLFSAFKKYSIFLSFLFFLSNLF